MGSKSPPDPVFVFRGLRSPVNCLNFITPEKNLEPIKYLGGGTQDGQVSIWNLKTKCVHHNWTAHDASVLWLRYVDSSSLFTAGRNKNVILWDLGKGMPNMRTNIPIQDYLGFSQCDFINFKGQQLLCIPGPGQENCTLWDLNSFNKICIIGPKDAKTWGCVMQCKWVDCGGKLYILIAYENGTLAMWDWSNGKVLNSVECNDNLISLEYNALQMKGICGTASEKIIIFSVDAETSFVNIHKEYNITNPGIGCCRSRIDGKIYALGGWDYRVRLFRWKKHKPLAVLSYHKKSVECLDFSTASVESFNSGCLLAAGSSDCTISLWNVYN